MVRCGSKSDGKRFVKQGGEEVLGLAQGLALHGPQPIHSLHQGCKVLLEGERGLYQHKLLKFALGDHPFHRLRRTPLNQQFGSQHQPVKKQGNHVRAGRDRVDLLIERHPTIRDDNVAD